MDTGREIAKIIQSAMRAAPSEARVLGTCAMRSFPLEGAITRLCVRFVSAYMFVVYRYAAKDGSESTMLRAV